MQRTAISLCLDLTARTSFLNRAVAGLSLVRPQISVSEILKVRGDTEVTTAHELDDSLQIVFLFSRDANLPVL